MNLLALRSLLPLLISLGAFVAACDLAPPDDVGETSAAVTVCGNGVCETGETCAGCPADCGRCSGDYCGDGRCGRKESCTTCPRDCGTCPGCGNGVCDAGETCA